jgi:hypothetical protein
MRVRVRQASRREGAGYRRRVSWCQAANRRCGDRYTRGTRGGIAKRRSIISVPGVLRGREHTITPTRTKGPNGPQSTDEFEQPFLQIGVLSSRGAWVTGSGLFNALAFGDLGRVSPKCHALTQTAL